jgi:hypothetical protein
MPVKRLPISWEDMNPGPEQSGVPVMNTLERLYNTAEIMLDDDEFMVFRRFNRLNVFNLLLLQKQLKHLEDTMEGRLKQNNEDDVMSLSFDLRNTLREYSKSSRYVAMEEFLLIKADEALHLQKILKDILDPRKIALNSFSMVMESRGYIEVLKGFIFPTKFDYISLFETEKSVVHQVMDKSFGRLFEVCITFY